MDAKRFYSVPYDGYADYGVSVLAERYGLDAAYGKWHILLGLLYDADGIIDIGNAMVRRMVANRLCLEDGEALEAFLELAAFVGYIDQRKLDEGVIMNEGVCAELEFRRQQRDNAQKGGRPAKTKRG